MDIARLATTRYTSKAYDPDKRIDAALIEQLTTLLRYAPSSVNSQPWHFVIASSGEAKARIAQAASAGPYAANGPKLRNASQVVVLCARADLDEAHLAHVLEQEVRDGRFPTDEARATQARSRAFYLNLHRNELQDTRHWMDKQVYLALGALLIGAAALEIDATPIEGYDHAALDQLLGLGERGLRSVVMAALGYRSAEDFNASLPKSRLPAGEIFTLL